MNLFRAPLIILQQYFRQAGPGRDDLIRFARDTFRQHQPYVSRARRKIEKTEERRKIRRASIIVSRASRIFRARGDNEKTYLRAREIYGWPARLDSGRVTGARLLDFRLECYTAS